MGALEWDRAAGGPRRSGRLNGVKAARPGLVDEPVLSQRRGYLLWTFLALLAATLLVYFPALTGGLLWDDDVHVTPLELRSVSGWVRILVEPGATQQYYPSAIPRSGSSTGSGETRRSATTSRTSCSTPWSRGCSACS